MKDTPRITAMQLAGGISKQPPHLRLPGQLEDAQNLNLSVVDGINKRAGTWLDRVLSGVLTAGGTYRLFIFDRDQDEKYAIVYGVIGSNFSIKAYRQDGNAATVNISADAQKYLNLNGATADEIRPRIFGDVIEWTNTTVMVGTLPGDTYSLTATWDTYSIMVSNTPADETYHRTSEDDGENEAGYWRYDVNGRTFATRRFAEVSGNYWCNTAGGWDDTLGADFSFRIGMQRRGTLASNATFTAASRTITGAAGNFSEARVGEFIYCKDGGFGATGVWHEIESITSTAAVVLKAGAGIDSTTGDQSVALPGVDSVANVNVTGLGGYFTCEWESPGNNFDIPTMYDQAAELQAALRAGGAEDALIAWTETGYQRGYFTITSTYRGSGATFFGPYPLTGAAVDLTAAGRPFNGSGGVTTAGTGVIDGSNPDTLDVDDRWTEAVESGQADAQIDPATMPVTMTRTRVASTSVFDVAEQTFDARATGTPTTNPSPSLWKKTGATQGTISGNTLANPTVVTSTAHGLTTGDTVHITDSNSTPTIDGARVVTVLTADTFSVPVNVTVAGTAGNWRKGGLAVRDAAFKDGRKVYGGGESVVFSQVRDSNDFYIADATNIVDSDPIDIPIGSEEVTNVDFLVPFRKTIVAFTLAGRQFELNTPEALTPSTGGWTASTSHATRSVRPVVMGSRLYFVGEAENYSVLYEYVYNDLTVSSTAFEVTTHVLDLLPTGVRTLAANGNNGMVLVLPEDDGETATMYVYKAFWNGEQKVQSAWGRWVFDAGYRICDIAVFGDRLWMLVESCGTFTSAAGNPNTTITSAAHGLSNGSTITIPSGASPAALVGTHVVANVTADTFTIAVITTEAGYGKWSLGEYSLEWLTLSREAASTGWPYAIHLDRKIELTGVHAAGTTTWTLTAPNGGSLTARGSTINRAVLGPAFGGDSGDEVTISTYGATNTVSVSGDYDAGVAVLGRYFDAYAELTRPFLRDARGDADFYGSIVTTDLIVSHYRSGDYSVSVNYSEGQADASTTFTPTGTLSGAADSILRAQAVGAVELAAVRITSSSAKPFTISAVQWIGDPADIAR